MSNRAALETAVLAMAALALGLGCYLGRARPSPVVPAVPPAADPAPGAKPSPEVKPRANLEEIAKQLADEGGRQSDPVEEYNRKAAETQTRPGAHIEKMARVGDEVVTLVFKPSAPWRMPKSYAFVDDKSGGFFAPLASDAANGDDFAAHQLWQNLQACEEAPKTQAELRDSVAKVEDAFPKTGGALPDGGAISLERAVAQVQARYDRCQGVTPQMYGEALEYLHQAADRGTHVSVALEYASAIARDKPDESRQRFQSLWQEGHVGGLSGLSVDSLPHRIAWNAQEIALLDGLPGPGRVLAMARERAAKLRNETSPSEYQIAAKEAARLLRNPNCCLDP